MTETIKNIWLISKRVGRIIRIQGVRGSNKKLNLYSIKKKPRRSFRKNDLGSVRLNTIML